MRSLKNASLIAVLTLAASSVFAQSASGDMTPPPPPPGPKMGAAPMADKPMGEKPMPAGHGEMKKHKDGKMHKKHSDATAPAAPEGAAGVGAPAQNPNDPHAKPVPGATNNQLYNGK